MLRKSSVVHIANPGIDILTIRSFRRNLEHAAAQTAGGSSAPNDAKGRAATALFGFQAQTKGQINSRTAAEFPHARGAIGGFRNKSILHTVHPLRNICIAGCLDRLPEHALLDINHLLLGQRNAVGGVDEHCQLLRTEAAETVNVAFGAKVVSRMK